ncbi:hypothetical protein ACJX0J_035417 [Zea mays]
MSTTNFLAQTYRITDKGKEHEEEDEEDDDEEEDEGKGGGKREQNQYLESAMPILIALWHYLTILSSFMLQLVFFLYYFIIHVASTILPKKCVSGAIVSEPLILPLSSVKDFYIVIDQAHEVVSPPFFFLVAKLAFTCLCDSDFFYIIRH